MEQGYNSDVVHGGHSYHIQTEDWGKQNPFVVTKVFRSGAVVLSLKTPYTEIPFLDVRLAMREQHQKVLDQLVSGTLLSGGIK